MNSFSLSELKKLSKSELGTLGESLVIEKLNGIGLQAINANAIHNNYASIDVICTNPKNGQTVGIQVKTSFDTNIPIGMSLKNCVREKLEEKVLGPWVFIHVEKDGSMRYYVLTREEMITVAHESNDWYMHKWKSSYRKSPVKETNACGLYIRWINGEDEKDNYKHEAFKNPLAKNGTEDRWDKILDCVNKDCLAKTLGNFRGVTECADERQKMTELDEQFEKIARQVFFGGYFQVNDCRRIYPEEIEFYYHEEDENGLKDPVMYHTDDHEKKPTPYFPLCALNFHASGLDVTFENQEKRCRASFLIRGYKVCDFDGTKWIETKLFEGRSTYIYEDMLMNAPVFNGITIKWHDVPSTVDPSWKPTKDIRKNVASYRCDELGRFIKDSNGNYIKEEIEKDYFDSLPSSAQQEYFSYSGKRYRKCPRKWNYKK